MNTIPLSAWELPDVLGVELLKEAPMRWGDDPSKRTVLVTRASGDTLGCDGIRMELADYPVDVAVDLAWGPVVIVEPDPLWSANSGRSYPRPRWRINALGLTCMDAHEGYWLADAALRGYWPADLMEFLSSRRCPL